VTVRTLHKRWAALTSVVVPSIVSWQAGVAAIGLVAAAYVLRLLGEWQRRKTLMALMRDAREGTVVLQHEGDQGSSLSVWVGAGLDQVPLEDPHHEDVPDRSADP
jgi:hypothetical protein